MGQRRSNRIQSRTDAQILAHVEDMALLVSIARGTYTRIEGDRHQLDRLNREDLVLTGYALTSEVHLLPRGRRLLAAHWGETPAPRVGFLSTAQTGHVDRAQSADRRPSPASSPPPGTVSFCHTRVTPSAILAVTARHSAKPAMEN